MVFRFGFCFFLVANITTNLCSQVWNKAGTLIGKFFLGMASANMVFANTGRLVILAETKIFAADIAAKGSPLT